MCKTFEYQFWRFRVYRKEREAMKVSKRWVLGERNEGYENCKK